ncbi:FAD-binding oxidoreductase [Streptomyces coeruleoprunus]|uniref:FAD-binding oxidoreductase n=1 Tax=Streptomyces coeruleoprunus TaxID=285563 RepID=A0ABV9XNA3_9ACTN
MNKLNRRRFLTVGSGVAVGTAAGLSTALPASAEVAEAAQAVGPSVTVTPSDPRYADLRSGMNQRWVATPEKIVLPRTTADVVSAVQSAVSAGKRITVSGGSHCFEDFVYNAETKVVLNMSLMNAVTFDQSRLAFCVQGGATLIDVYEALHGGWGVTLPGGICHSVGIGGHVLGGGFGMLSRQHGLIVDHLHAVEVVVVDANGMARAVVATRDPADPNHDLFWAHTGGGGGSFGVVTRFWFRTPGATGSDPTRLLPKAPSEIYISSIFWPWSKVTQDGFSRLVTYYGEWLERNNSPGTTGGSLFSWMLLNHRVAGNLGLIIQIDASLPGAADVLSDYLAGLNAAVGVPTTPVRRDGVVDSEYSTTRKLPWLRGTKYIGSVSPTQLDPTMRGIHKSSHLLRPTPQNHIDAMYKHLNSTDPVSPYAGIVYASAGGRISSVSSTATAVAQRAAIMKTNFESVWYEPGDDAVNVSWVRRAFADVYADTGGVPVPNTVTDGCYINYPDGDLGDPQYNASAVPWHDLYWKGNYARLQRVKRVWDPTNVFRHRQSVQLS